MVFIGYDYSGNVISIVNAVSREIANAYWQGADIIPHSIKSLKEDFEPLKDHPTGVYPILKTVVLSVYSLKHDAKIIAVSK